MKMTQGWIGGRCLTETVEVADSYYQKVNAERICWYLKRL